jgi:hypothetical protein
MVVDSQGLCELFSLKLVEILQVRIQHAQHGLLLSRRDVSEEVVTQIELSDLRKI